MATAQLGAVGRVIDQVRGRVTPDHGDGELLHRYNRDRDEDSFTLLVRRHGPMVLGVCRRVLRDPHAAEDAFQATFLVLAKKADTVRPPGVLGPWLYGVAYRTALKARGREFRRQSVEREYARQASREMSVPQSDAATELAPLIDEQLNALPEKYRQPLVLCAVQGLGKSEAARRLGLPEGTVSSRLARAREMLRERLARRGVIVPATALAAFLIPGSLRAAVPPSAVTAAAEVAAGLAPISPTVLILSHEVLQAMTLVKWKLLGAVAVAVALTGGGFGVYVAQADDKKPADKPAVTKPDAEKPVKPGTKPDAEKPTTTKPDPDKPATTKPDPEKPDKPAAVKPDQPKPDKPKPDPEKPTTIKPKPEPDKPTTTKPDGEKPKPKPEPDKPKPEGQKPATKQGGKITGVNPTERTITILQKRDNGVIEEFVKLAPDAKVFIDGKPAALKDVPKGAMATFVAAGKEGTAAEITELRVSGPNVTGVVVKAEASGLTLDIPGKEGNTTKVFKLAPDVRVQIGGGKDTKPTDLKPGDKVVVTLTADESAALVITGAKPDGEKTPGKFGGKIVGVDPAARTITLMGKGEGGAKEIVVKLTPDAKVLVDGKETKLADVPKGATAAFIITPAKDGTPLQASEVVIAGPTVVGTVKQLDATTITVTAKTDRVIQLLPTTKVLIGGKDAKPADIKVGDKVAVTLSTDESAAILISDGAKGDKKPDEDDDE
ncbi:MAG TPA: sigma-70 family RNA polymerase sigma factor [Gemmataceae bacterium]|nr:sigma-70 family RNA polymerase sigma factor [Gemmataceae bacterium]